jgi:hypothetical protein
MPDPTVSRPYTGVFEAWDLFVCERVEALVRRLGGLAIVGGRSSEALFARSDTCWLCQFSALQRRPELAK